MLSWRALKDQGRVEYERDNFEQALSLYERAAHSATTTGASIFDRQVIWSNIVACRLKVGGSINNERALQDAQECLRLNPSWSKAHVRLASAYIALGRSNDACNALQTALRHDPSNTTARQMLLQQLRGRDHHHQRHNPAHEAASAGRNAAASSPARRRPDDDGPSLPPRQSPPLGRPGPSTGNSSSTQMGEANDRVDDTMSLTDRWRSYWSRGNLWYSSLSESRQSAIQLLVVLLALYISFGGRFGLEMSGRGTASSSSPHRSYDEDHYGGDYGRGSATHWNLDRRAAAAADYESYRTDDIDSGTHDRRPRRQQQRNHEYRNNDEPHRRSSSHYYHHRDRGYNDDHRDSYYSHYRSNRHNYGYSSSTSSSPPWTLILIVAAVAYIIARRNGINAWPLLLFLRAGLGGFGGGYGGVFYGGGGGGRLFGGRQRHNRGRMF